jgi:hypothetical protein
LTHSDTARSKSSPSPSGRSEVGDDGAFTPSDFAGRGVPSAYESGP